MQESTCSVSDCDRLIHTMGMCNAHYLRLRSGIPMDQPIKVRNQSPVPCAVNNCSEMARALNMCESHYDRFKRGVSMDKPIRKHTGRRVTRHGYVRLLSPKHPFVGADGCVFEHRLVMENVLGRYLEPWENVHHKNGIRDDNRPENLELWVKPQPAGQRAIDLARWVAENYPDLVSSMLANQEDNQC